jgi:hypothetical protein
MGRTQQRSAEEIRERAIATAVAKHDEGCVDCAKGYLHVAKQHGATEDDLRRVGMGRRTFLKFAIATFAATAAATSLDLLHPAPSVKAELLQRGAYFGSFGVDSCTPLEAATGQAMPLQFYIGEVGATQYGLNCLDARTAAYAGPDFTYAYWGLCGPNNATDAANYGRLQAELALAAIHSRPEVGGQTFFADVEYGFGGWGDPATPAQNVALLDAFLSTIAGAGYTPGVYINNSSRDSWFPSDYVAAAPFVYWMAGGPQAGTMCAPCQPNCDTLTPVQQLWDQFVSQETFGGYRTVLWQYWLSDFGCAGDFIFSPQSAYRTFAPVSVKEQPLTTHPIASPPATETSTPTETPQPTETPAPAPTDTPQPVFQPTPSMG